MDRQNRIVTTLAAVIEARETADVVASFNKARLDKVVEALGSEINQQLGHDGDITKGTFYNVVDSYYTQKRAAILALS